MLSKEEVELIVTIIEESNLVESFLAEERVAVLGETTDWSMWQIARRLQEKKAA